MEEHAWVVDDNSVPDDAHVFRRLPTKPPFVSVPDALGGPKELGIAVYKYDNDGMSVYSSAAMAHEGIAYHDLIDWSDKSLCVVPVAVVRRSLPLNEAAPGAVSPGATHEVPGGVVTDEVEHADPRVGRTHALVRVALEPSTKSQVLKPVWNAFRRKLLDATQFKLERDGVWIRQPSRNADA